MKKCRDGGGKAGAGEAGGGMFSLFLHTVNQSECRARVPAAPFGTTTKNHFDGKSSGETIGVAGCALGGINPLAAPAGKAATLCDTRCDQMQTLIISCLFLPLTLAERVGGGGSMMNISGPSGIFVPCS